MFDGSVDGEKFYQWIDRLEMYFMLYGYMSLDKIHFSVLRLCFHAISYWKTTRKQGDGVIS